MDLRLAPLAATLRLNSRLMANCLDEVDDGMARRRLGADSNHLAFLAAHLIDSRHFMAGFIGAPLENPLAGVLERGKTLDQVGELPPLDRLRDAWRAVSDHLVARLAEVAPEALDAESSVRMPIGDRSVLGTLAFFVQHDSYHVGQMSLLRRQLGLPAMSYR